MRTERTHIQNEEKKAEFPWTHNKEGGLGKLNPILNKRQVSTHLQKTKEECEPDKRCTYLLLFNFLINILIYFIFSNKIKVIFNLQYW